MAALAYKPAPSPVSIERVERALFSRPGGMYRFMAEVWPLVEQRTPFNGGWHIEEVCAHLEAVSRGEIDRLIINIPPGMSKSTAVSVCWQCWDWGPYGHPERRYMAASFDESLTKRDALKARSIITSDWYQNRWGMKANLEELKAEGLKPFTIARATEDRRDTAGEYWTTEGGLRFSTSVGGKATGWHCHHQIVDDPTNPTLVQGDAKQAMSQLDKDWAWYNGTMSTRQADPEHFARVVIMQRLHASDVAGRAKEMGYVVLSLPMNFNAKMRCTTRWGGDRRTVDGELLQPTRYTAEAVTKLRQSLGPLVSAAQLDQNPNPEKGLTFQKEWFNKRFKFLPRVPLRYLQSWDFTFKKTTDSDYVCGLQWAYGDGNFYLLDGVCVKAGFLASLKLARAFSVKWGRVNQRTLIEDKANGTAIMEVLQAEIPGILPYSPTDSKEARANAVTGYWEAGNVLIYEEMPLLIANAECPVDFITQHTQFPRGSHDDMVDASTQGLLYMTGKTRRRNRLKDAMDNAFGKGPGRSH